MGKKQKLTRRQRARQHFLFLLDSGMAIVGVIGPISAIPQTVQILSAQTAAGVSLTSWLLFVFFNSYTLVYAIFRGLWPLIIANFLWVLVDLSVVAAILIYS